MRSYSGFFVLTISLPFLLYAACGASGGKQDAHNKEGVPVSGSADDTLPPPDSRNSHVNFSKVIGWPEGKTPIAPPGFRVTRFAGGIKSPRNIYAAPNGDIFIALANSERKGSEKIKNLLSGKSKSEQVGASANTVLLYRDADHDGRPELGTAFLTDDLRQPYGMLVLGDYFYVANTDALVRYPYKAGQTQMSAGGQKVLDLPAGGYNNHWTRNLIASPDGSKIYVSVGSGSNVAEHGIEHEARRACILEVHPDGSGERIYASGLRNPVGMDWNPQSRVLWTAVNERDELGDRLVPDYITGVREGGFYGWPYAYFGAHEDPRRKGERPDLVRKTLVPDVALGAHTASLGLAFYTGTAFPEKYRNGVFIGQHGSWNHSQLVGYKVVFVPFRDGKPAGPPEDFLTGFIANERKSEVYGRPVDVAVLPDGSLLVSDDVSDVVWRVAYQ